MFACLALMASCSRDRYCSMTTARYCAESIAHLDATDDITALHDPSAGTIAVYDPRTKTITLSRRAQKLGVRCEALP